MRTRSLSLLCLPLLIFSACSDSPTAVDASPPDNALLTALFLTATGPGTSSACPAGGELSRETHVDQSVMTDVLTTTWRVTIEFRACAVRAGDAVLVTDGTLALAGFERRALLGSGGRLLEQRVEQKGTLRWRGDGHDRTCQVDLVQTIDPQTNVRRLKGTICGDAVDMEFTLPQR